MLLGGRRGGLLPPASRAAALQPGRLALARPRRCRPICKVAAAPVRERAAVQAKSEWQLVEDDGLTDRALSARDVALKEKSRKYQRTVGGV